MSSNTNNKSDLLANIAEKAAQAVKMQLQAIAEAGGFTDEECNALLAQVSRNLCNSVFGISSADSSIPDSEPSVDSSASTSDFTLSGSDGKSKKTKGRGKGKVTSSSPKSESSQKYMTVVPGSPTRKRSKKAGQVDGPAMHTRSATLASASAGSSNQPSTSAENMQVDLVSTVSVPAAGPSASTASMAVPSSTTSATMASGTSTSPATPVPGLNASNTAMVSTSTQTYRPHVPLKRTYAFYIPTDSNHPWLAANAPQAPPAPANLPFPLLLVAPPTATAAATATPSPPAPSSANALAPLILAAPPTTAPTPALATPLIVDTATAAMPAGGPVVAFNTTAISAVSTIPAVAAASSTSSYSSSASPSSPSSPGLSSEVTPASDLPLDSATPSLSSKRSWDEANENVADNTADAGPSSDPGPDSTSGSPSKRRRSS